MIKSTFKYIVIISLLAISSAVIADRIESRRIAGFCNSVKINSEFNAALEMANHMPGVTTKKSPALNSFTIDSRFALFRFCTIESANNKVTKTYTTVSVDCHFTSNGYMDCRQ